MTAAPPASGAGLVGLMANTDDLLGAIETIHAAGLDAARWPQALAAVADLCGGVAATLEAFDKPAQRHREFYAFGVPPIHEIAYADRYLAINPRVPLGLRQHVGDIGWDHQILDEAGMARDPFYAEFLPRVGFRYFVSGVLQQTPKEFAVVAVQRTSKQGHVTQADIEMMERLVPHFRQARDVATRLKRTAATSRSLEGALDWLADGVALVRADGAILYVNDSLQAIARRRDGLRIVKGAFVFQAPETRARFAAAMVAIARLRAGDTTGAGATDLVVARGAAISPYLLSVRPLLRMERNGDIDARAVAIVFIRDPLSHNPAASQVLREVFCLTEAETDLARALQSGTSAAQYAHERAVSLNTIYTHLRRIKEKTGCKRMGELIRKLNDLQVPLRSG
jgi:DNA-binding CsgD family transcriptional regulator